METTAKYVKRGAPLYVEGRIQYRSYQDEEGQARGVAEVVASDVQFLARRGDRPAPDDASHANRPALSTEVAPDEFPF